MTRSIRQQPGALKADGSIVQSAPYWADSGAVHQVEPIEVDGVLTLRLSAVLPGGIKFR